MLQEFKKFAMRGNVLDLAVAVIIGAAFGKITTSLVGDILMPPIGKLMGGVNFADKFINLSDTPYATLADAKKAGAATINYGLFLNTIIDFVLVAAAVFVLVKIASKLQPPASSLQPTSKDCPHCCMAIPVKATRCGHCTSQLG